MLVPLIRTLQNKLPNAQLTWVISKPAFYLVEGMEGVEFIVIDKPKTPADYWRFRKQMLPRQFDVLLAPKPVLELIGLFHSLRPSVKSAMIPIEPMMAIVCL